MIASNSACLFGKGNRYSYVLIVFCRLSVSNCFENSSYPKCTSFTSRTHTVKCFVINYLGSWQRNGLNQILTINDAITWKGVELVGKSLITYSGTCKSIE